MKFFETKDDHRRIVVYKNFDLSLMERHNTWCKTEAHGQVPIYLIFLLRNVEEIKEYKSNRLNNRFCLAWFFPETRTDEWLTSFCITSFLKPVDFIKRTSSQEF